MLPVDLARQELAAGVREPEAYARYSGGRDEAWCAHFVSWLFRTAGKPLPGSVVPGPGVWSPTAGCNYIAKRMSEEGKILPAGAIPQPNDIILYKSADRKTGGFQTPGLYGFPFVYGHIGLVTDVVEENGVKKVVSIEGNYSNKVALVKTRLDSPTIGLFARPETSFSLSRASTFGGPSSGGGGGFFGPLVFGASAAALAVYAWKRKQSSTG